MGDQNEAGDTPYGILFSNPVLDKLAKAGVITKSHFDKLDQERLKSYFYNVLSDILPYQLRAKYSDQSKAPYQEAKEIADKAFDHIKAINSYVESENKTMQWYVGQVHAILSAAKAQGVLIAADIWAEFRQRVIAFNSQQEAERIHTENLNHLPTIPNKTILCHIVADSILPVNQRGMLNRLAIETRKAKYCEKVIRLSVEDPYNPEEFMKKLEEAKAQDWIEEYRDKGYTVLFDVACPNKKLVGMVDVPALAFNKEGEGDMIQVEGIILALRVLRIGKVDDLLKVYRLLTGEEFRTYNQITDIKELAKAMLFTLPVTAIFDIGKRDRLNTLIEKNIKQAA